MDDLFNLGKRTRVIYECGYFPDTNRPRFTDASFNLVFFNGYQYLVPQNTNRASSQRAAVDWAIHNDMTDGDAFRLSKLDWYYDGTLVTMGEHEMGDYKGHPEDWKGMHKFSPI